MSSMLILCTDNLFIDPSDCCTKTGLFIQQPDFDAHHSALLPFLSVIFVKFYLLPPLGFQYL